MKNHKALTHWGVMLWSIIKMSEQSVSLKSSTTTKGTVVTCRIVLEVKDGKMFIQEHREDTHMLGMDVAKAKRNAIRVVEERLVRGIIKSGMFKK